MSFILSAIVAAGATAVAAHAQTTFVETFDSAAPNADGWSFAGSTFNPLQIGTDSIPLTGGRPAAYLRGSGLRAAAPVLSTTPSANLQEFAGDFRARGVTSIGADFSFITATPLNDTNGRDMYLFLGDDRGTPDSPADDCWVFTFIAGAGPISDDGWHPVDFAIPSDQTSIPTGWSVRGCSAGGPSGVWNDIVTDVDYVTFAFGDPFAIWPEILRTWDIKADNIRITRSVSLCPVDWNGDGGVDVFDLLAYLEDWFALDPAAELDLDPGITVFDLLAYLNGWFTVTGGTPCP